MVTGESNVSLLLASWGVEGVDLLNLELVKLLAGLLDHSFVGLFVHNEYKSVVVLNGLDGRLAAEWVLDHSELIESVVSLDGSEENLWASLLGLADWSSERHLGPDLGLLSGMSTFLHSG